jgi:hypothetical protein
MSMSVFFNMEIWVRSISLISRLIPMHIFKIDQYTYVHILENDQHAYTPTIGIYIFMGVCLSLNELGDGCFPTSTFLFVLQWAILIHISHNKINETWDTPQNESFYWKREEALLAHMNRFCDYFSLFFFVGNLCSTMFHVGHGFVRCNTYTLCQLPKAWWNYQIKELKGFCESIIVA